MDIVRRKDIQKPTFEVNSCGAKDLRTLATWIRDHATEAPLFMVVGAVWVSIQNKDEATAFARGLEMAESVVESERPAVSFWADYDDVCYVVLAFSRDHVTKLGKLGDQFLRELFLAKWVEHIDDVPIRDGRLLMRREAWEKLSLNQQRSLLDRAQGFIEALDA